MLIPIKSIEGENDPSKTTSPFQLSQRTVSGNKANRERGLKDDEVFGIPAVGLSPLDGGRTLTS